MNCCVLYVRGPKNADDKVIDILAVVKLPNRTVEEEVHGRLDKIK